MLSGEVCSLLAGRPLNEIVTSETARHALRAGVGPLLFSTARRQGCALDPGAALSLAKAQLRAVARERTLTADLAAIREIAAHHGYSTHVFKGLASGHMLYDAPGERPMADLDLYLGNWCAEARSTMLHALKVDPRRTRAFEALVAKGAPLHELTAYRSTINQHANVDAHLNPYGLITRFRGRDVAGCWVPAELAGVGQVHVPSPEFALIISLLNQIRKGGGAANYLADTARLLDERAGPLDWDRYNALVAADGLAAVCAQTLAETIRGLGLEVDLPFALPANRSWWAPVFGELEPKALRRMTFVPLHRPPRFLPESLGALIRLYVPGSLMLDARGFGLDDGNGMRRRWKMVRHRIATTQQ